MSVITADAFRDVLEKSEVLSAEQVEQAKAQEGDGKAVARWLISQGWLTTWQAKLLLAGRTGLRLGKYILLDRMKRASGDLFLAEHSQLSRRVAIKVLSPAETADPKQLQEFLAIGVEVAKLDHPNITRIYDINNEAERYYIVIEHVEGSSVEALIEQEGALDAHTVAQFVRQAAEGLAHVHEKEIVHGRIHPGCFLVDTNGVVKLQDLGMKPIGESGSNGNGADATDPLAKKFLAPEQQLGKAGDHRSDIFALGATAMYMLTGEIPSDSSAAPTSALEKIFRKMMAAQPDTRLQSADLVVKWMDKWLLQNPPPEEDPLIDDVEDISNIEIEEIEETGADGSPGLPSPFSIDTASADTASADAVPTSDEEASEKSLDAKSTLKDSTKAKSAGKGESADEKPKSKVSLLLVLGIGVALMFVLVICTGAGATAMYFILKGSETESMVAVATTAGTDGGGVESGGNEATGATDEPEDDASGAGTEASGGDPDPSNDKKDPFVMRLNQNDEAADAENPKGTDPATTQVAKTDDPSKPNGDPATTNPKPTEDKAPPTTPKPDAGKEADPKKPVAETKPMPKPKPPTPVDPLRALRGKAFDLPDFETAEGLKELVLGPLKVEKADTLLFNLSGGKNAHKGLEYFTMEGAIGESGDREYGRSWVFKLNYPDGHQAAIGELWIAKNQLKFQWTKEAEKHKSTGYLRNCVLSMVVGGNSTDLKFRKPAPLDAVVLDLDKTGAGEAKASFDDMPARESMFVEVWIEGAFPKHAFQPRSNFEVKGDPILIQIGEPIASTRDAQIFPAFITFDAKLRTTGLSITANFSVNLPGARDRYTPKKFSAKQLELILRQESANVIRQGEVVRQFATAGKDPNKQQQVLIKNRVSRADVEQMKAYVARVQPLLQKYTQVKDEFAGLVKNAKFHVRVYHRTDDPDNPGSLGYEVVLAQSAVPPKKKKPAKK